MRAGRLHNKICFGLMVPTSDGQGGVTEVFREITSVYGRSIPSASTTTVGSGVRNEYVFRFESRFVSGIRPNMVFRVDDDPSIWSITDVIDPSGKGERLEFTGRREIENAVLPPPEPPEDNDEDNDDGENQTL